MINGYIKTAAAVPELRVADCRFNEKKTAELAVKAAEQGAAVIVFPELGMTGYTCEDLFLQDTLLDAAEMAIKTLAADTATLDALIFAGLPLRAPGGLYNCAVALFRGKILGIVPKTHLPNYAEFYEARRFTKAPDGVKMIEVAGQTCPFGTKILFNCKTIPGLKIAAEICEDLWSQLPSSVGHCAAGATLVVNLSASDEMVGKPEYRRDLVKMHSAHQLCGYVYTSAGCGESTTDLVFAGHSMICENGSLLAENPPFGAGLVMSEIDVSRLLYERRRMMGFKSGDDLGYTTVDFGFAERRRTALTREYARFPFVPSDMVSRGERCRFILDMQAHGLAKRIQHTGAKTMVIGISGGLDSTLALIAAVRAAEIAGKTPSDILTVTMPCFGTGERTLSNATKLCSLLGTKFMRVDIGESVKRHLADIGHDETTYDVTYENAQARERTQVLMDLSNKTGGIVVGTGDLSEIALGWSTYNGDHMSMYAVNCGVPKTLVRHVIGNFADSCDSQELSAVLRDILDTPVSPELVPSAPGEIQQKTEDILGNYELHDYFLYYFVRCGFAPDKIMRIALRTFSGIYDEEYIKKTLKLFCRRFFAQQFKRSCIPDGVKIGSVALSPRGDWRMPSDACSVEWMSKID